MIAHPLNPAQCAYLALSVVLLVALAWVWLTMEDESE